MSITLWKREPNVLIHQALGKACEEASELANILARCLIQGLDQLHPGTGKPNRHALSDEIADLDAAVQWLRELTGDMYDEERADRKLSGFRRWQRMLEEDAAGAPAPETNMVACPCTLIEQDEECPVGYPSLICGVCKGIGNTTPDQVTALACEMIKISSDTGEPEDPFAAWESIDLIKSQHAQFRKALDKISGMIDDESAGFDEAIETATYALRLAKAEATTEGSAR